MLLRKSNRKGERKKNIQKTSCEKIKGWRRKKKLGGLITWAHTNENKFQSP